MVRDAAFVMLTGAMDKPCPVYESIPATVKMPYLLVGDKTEVPFDSFGNEGYQDTITFTAFSAYKGDQELLEINKWLMTMLHRVPLTLSDGTSARMKSELMLTQRQLDGTRQLINRFRVIARS